MLPLGALLAWSLWPAAAVPPQDPPTLVDEIEGLGTLGLPSSLRQRFSENETICLLIHPRWSHPDRTLEALTSSIFRLPDERPDDDRFVPIPEGQARSTLIGAESDFPAVRKHIATVAESFVFAVFDKRPKFEFSLAKLVSETTFLEAPLLVFDPIFRVRKSSTGDRLEAWLTVRLFHLRIGEKVVDGKSVRHITGCELLFEDRALGSVPLRQEKLDVALRASIVDALRGKLVVSLVLDGLMKHSLVVRRRDLLGESLGSQSIGGGSR